jgi:hypothetical protein
MIVSVTQRQYLSYTSVPIIRLCGIHGNGPHVEEILGESRLEPGSCLQASQRSVQQLTGDLHAKITLCSALEERLQLAAGMVKVCVAND